MALSPTPTPTPGAELAPPSELLLEAAVPDLYRVNAFRITGLAVTAGPRDVARRGERLKMMERLSGGSPAADGALPLDPPPDSEAVRAALQRLHDPERRLVDEFFWFWPPMPGDSHDDEAFELLGKGDLHGAAAVWSMREYIGTEAYVSTHNLAVYHHAAALDWEQRANGSRLTQDQARERDEHWRQAYQRWRLLLVQEGFWSRLTARIRELDDPRLTTGTARRMRAALPLALLSINARLAVVAAERNDAADVKRQIDVMRRWDGDAAAKPPRPERLFCPRCGRIASTAVKPDAFWCTSCNQEVSPPPQAAPAPAALSPLAEEALRRALASIRDRIQTLCRTAEPEADADPPRAHQIAQRLVDDTAPLLRVLDHVLPPGEVTRDAAHDEVALRVLGCEITYGNKTQRWHEIRALLDRVLPVAASESARARLRQNIEIVQNNISFDEFINTCWFCSRRRADAGAVVAVKMHQESLTQTLLGTRTGVQNQVIEVPRCTRCQEAHARVERTTGIGITIGWILGLGSCVGGISGGRIALGIAAIILGAVIGAQLSRRMLPRGVEPAAHARKHPRVADALKRGWKLGEKSPAAR